MSPLVILLIVIGVVVVIIIALDQPQAGVREGGRTTEDIANDRLARDVLGRLERIPIGDWSELEGDPGFTARSPSGGQVILRAREHDTHYPNYTYDSVRIQIDGKYVDAGYAGPNHERLAELCKRIDDHGGHAKRRRIAHAKREREMEALKRKEEAKRRDDILKRL